MRRLKGGDSSSLLVVFSVCSGATMSAQCHDLAANKREKHQYLAQKQVKRWEMHYMIFAPLIDLEERVEWQRGKDVTTNYETNVARRDDTMIIPITIIVKCMYKIIRFYYCLHV